MRAAIYNPYLDTLGGGERYSMAFAQSLVRKGYRVNVQWKNPSIKKKLKDRFGISLEGVNFVKDVKRGDGYDICFWVSDGSIPLLRARKNILHFQIPFKNIGGRTLLNRMKLFRINSIVCNSRFTKKHIDKEFGVKSIVLYPPIDVEKLKPGKKENLIISIGRFSQLTQAKRQDVLVSSFKKIYDSGFRDWKMILAGGVEVGVTDYVKNLREKAKGYPIEIIESPSWKELRQIYGKAKIFWTASGYGVDEEKDPKGVEHFGITIVEAMAAGVAPFAYKAGGHKEIITDDTNGYLWLKNSELIKKTSELIQNEKLLRKLVNKARKDSYAYNYERYKEQVLQLLTRI